MCSRLHHPVTHPPTHRNRPTSVMEAMPTPPTMGSSVASSRGEGLSPRKMADSTTEKNGSMACVGRAS